MDRCWNEPEWVTLKACSSSRRLSLQPGSLFTTPPSPSLLPACAARYPHRFTGFAKLSETEQAAQLKGQQALLYVAMSRARDRLWISGVGRASAWVERVAR